MAIKSPKEFKITSTEWWYKPLEMLSQNWALVEVNSKTKAVTVYFFYDEGLILGNGGPSTPIKFYKSELLDYASIIDSLEFENSKEAEQNLKSNGFKLIKQRSITDSYAPDPPRQKKFFDAKKYHSGIYSNDGYWIKSKEWS